MNIDALSATPIDPIQMVTAGGVSPAIAQASQETSGAQVQNPLQKEKPSAEEIKQDIDAINTQLKSMNSSIQFVVDGKANDIVIKIVDDDTGKVIRQIPSDAVISIRANLKKMTGLLVEERA